MPLKDYTGSRPLSLAVALSLLLSAAPARARQEEEVVRITSELVQTDVAVFDRQGQFVDGLRPEQFELQVNGRTRAVTFFERVRAGSRSEEAQLAAAARRHGRHRPPLQAHQRPALPDLRLQRRARGGDVQLRAQVLRGSTPLVNTQTFKVPAAPDPARLPFWSELSLEQLTPGHYVLQLTATDRTTNRTASERVGFYVD